MCRFLIVKSKQKINPSNLLNKFASACEQSIAPDGERQKDGFGVAWKKEGEWLLSRSLLPIWEGKDLLNKVPETNFFAVHARGSGFERDRDNIDYNQPFVDDDLVFVFNGIIRKVKLRIPLEGKIGSQKLFSLIKNLQKKQTLEIALTELKNLILKNSEKVEGMNIGLITDSQVSVLCQYDSNDKYYTLHYFENDDLLIISSEEFGDYDWKSLEKGEIKTFKLEN